MNDSLLLDTHALVWLVEGDQRLGRDGRELAEVALRADTIMVSAISFWELAMLSKHRRLVLAYSMDIWRRTVLQLGIAEVPMAGDIGIIAAELDGLPGDPADRIIMATALLRGCTLLTADERILGWGGTLPRHDARR
ncbi:MAG: type II toxin-antitoxin system VapC family toxin [Dehalococcoidia bacterium]|nr:type II toxin-antitoxin system VapC family toxin [Dehalococcoidia bacterium]